MTVALVPCGSSLDGDRADARFCSPACRREYYRLSRLVIGESDSGYGKPAVRPKG